MLNKFCPVRLSDLWFLDNQSNNVCIFSDKNLSLNKFQLNEIGTFIWKHCSGKFSNEDIAKRLYDEIEGAKPNFEEILADVNNLLFELQKNELVSWESNSLLDVLFIIPSYPSIYSLKAINTPEYSAPPLGVAYIASVLRENEYRVAIYDMHIKATLPEDIIKEYRKTKPKIVGISSTTPTFPNAVRIAKLLKAWDENVIIVIGGAHATSLPEECAKIDAIDYVVIGEGELVMLNLADAIIRKKSNLCQVNGLAYLTSTGNVRFSNNQQRIYDLDTLSYPARDLLDIDLYYKKGSIVSTRGCPYDCNYCACSAIAGHTYRRHSVDYVLKEIAFLIKKYDFKYFDFHDDTFNLIPNRVFEFCNEIIKRQMNLQWGCFCRASNFKYEMAKAMKDAGCEVIQFGIESGNQEVLNSIRKKTTLHEIEEAVIAANKAGIKQIACGFIIGHANDTEQTANETIDFGIKLAKLGATRLTISVLTPYPGTEVYKNMGKMGIKLITKDWEQFVFSRVVIETKNLKKNKLREIYAKGVYKFLQATNKPEIH